MPSHADDGRARRGSIALGHKSEPARANGALFCDRDAEAECLDPALEPLPLKGRIVMGIE
jgi:hypothetical protein